jgi:hypothetical protein
MCDGPQTQQSSDFFNTSFFVGAYSHAVDGVPIAKVEPPNRSFSGLIWSVRQGRGTRASAKGKNPVEVMSSMQASVLFCLSQKAVLGLLEIAGVV